MESYRNEDDRICHRTILNVGFMEDTTAAQRHKIQTILGDRYEMKQTIFNETDHIVNGYVSALWKRIVEEKRLDLGMIAKRSRMINADTMTHSNARDTGSEWMCYQTWERLGLSGLLASQGWGEEQVRLDAAHVVGRQFTRHPNFAPGHPGLLAGQYHQVPAEITRHPSFLD